MADEKKPAAPAPAKPAPAEPAPAPATAVERGLARVEPQPDTSGAKKTGDDTHRANQRGYANGVLLEANDLIPRGVIVSDIWMDPIKKSERALAGATDEALDVHPKDVDLTQLQPAALQALCAFYGINPGDLSKEDMITAIKARHDPAR